MRISNNLEKHAVFKAGLTPQIRREIGKINTSSLEKEFAKLNVECHLKDNQALGGILAYSANILEEGFNKYSLPVIYLPPSIYVYNNSELIDKELTSDKTTGFCITDADKIIENEAPFDISSVFIKNQPDNIDYLDKLAENAYNEKFSASAHFLQYIFHELFHAIHLDLIFKKDGYNGESPFGKELYKNPYIKYPKGLYTVESLNSPISSMYKKYMIKNNLGAYASTSKTELFAEAMTKLFTDSINSDEMTLKNNPLDNLKNYPKFIQRFIKRELD